MASERVGTFLLMSVAMAGAAMTGCHWGSLRPADKAPIACVFVSDRIHVPGAMGYMDANRLRTMSVCGLAGAAASAPGAQERIRDLKRVMKDGSIKIDRILQEEFVKGIEEAKTFPLIKPESKDCARFELSVIGYGLEPDRRQKEKLRAHLAVKAKLLSVDGKVIWRDAEVVNLLSEGVPCYSYDDYVTNPTPLETTFRAASRLVARKLVESLTGR